MCHYTLGIDQRPTIAVYTHNVFVCPPKQERHPRDCFFHSSCCFFVVVCCLQTRVNIWPYLPHALMDFNKKREYIFKYNMGTLFVDEVKGHIPSPDVNLHHSQTAIAGNTSSPGTVMFFLKLSMEKSRHYTVVYNGAVKTRKSCIIYKRKIGSNQNFGN